MHYSVNKITFNKQILDMNVFMVCYVIVLLIFQKLKYFFIREESLSNYRFERFSLRKVPGFSF